MEFVLRKRPNGIPGNMIVKAPKSDYPQIIQRPYNRVYLSKLVPPTYEYYKTALYDLENSYEILRSKVVGLTGDNRRKISSRLAAVCHQLAHAYYDTDFGIGRAVPMFKKAITVVEDLETDPDNVLTVINALNMLAFLEANHTVNTDKALEYLNQADVVYKEFRDATPEIRVPTTADELLKHCSQYHRTWAERTYKKHPLVNARLYTLFYYIEVYKILKMTDREVFYSHAALKHQMDNDVYMQCPLDWIQTCTQMSELLLKSNAFQQAKHHIAAAAMYVDVIMPEKYSYYNETTELKQYSADVSYSWSRYGMRLLRKSKTRLIKNKTHKTPPSIFDNLLFDQFTDTHGGEDTTEFVETFEDAEKLANDTIKWIEETTQHYTFDMSPTFFTYINIDKCHTYKNLAFFQENSNLTVKLLKKAIEDMEYLVFRIEGKNLLPICRQMWYELGNIYREMMDIKYKIHVCNKSEISKFGSKIINKYSADSILYFMKFIKSYDSFPEGVEAIQKRPILFSHLQLANCYDKQIAFTKDVKLKNIMECEKQYKTIINYCEAYPELEELIPFELSCCKEMLEAVPSKISCLEEVPKTSKYFL